MAVYHSLVGASCSRQSPSTEQRIPEIPANKSRLFSFPLFQTCEQDPSIHQKRTAHLPLVFSLGILPKYIFQAPLLLRCSLNHLERNLPPELASSKCSLMDTHNFRSGQPKILIALVHDITLHYPVEMNSRNVLPALRGTIWSILLVLHLAWHYFMASPNI